MLALCQIAVLPHTKVSRDEADWEHMVSTMFLSPPPSFNLCAGLEELHADSTQRRARMTCSASIGIHPSAPCCS